MLTNCRTRLVAQLANRLDERQRFDVADRAADLAQHEIQIVGLGQRERLDRVGDVRDHLHGRAEIVAAPFARDDLLINRPEVTLSVCRAATPVKRS